VWRYSGLEAALVGTRRDCRRVLPPNPRSGALYSVPPDERDLEAVSMHIRRFVFLQGNDVGVLELSLET